MITVLLIAAGALVGIVVSYSFGRSTKKPNPESKRQANEIANRLQKWEFPLLHQVFEELAMGNQRGVFKSLRAVHRSFTDDDTLRETLFRSLKKWLTTFLKSPEHERVLLEIVKEHQLAKAAREVETPTHQVISGISLSGPTDRD